MDEFIRRSLWCYRKYVEATGSHSFGFGRHVTSSGLLSFSMGDNTQATGAYSFALGSYVEASADYSFIIGRSPVGNPIGGLFLNDTWSSLKIGFGTPSSQPSLMITGVGQESKFSPEYYGYVGIFTDNPTSELDVNGTIKTLGFEMPGGTEGYVLTYNGTTGLAEWRQSLSGGSGSESLWNSNGTFVYYNTNNVGIGTSTPQEKLHVAGTILTQGGIKMLGTTNTLVFGDDANSRFQIVRNEVGSKGTNPPPAGFQHKILTITADNYIGIGTDTPGTDLDVVGEIKTDDLTVTQDANIFGDAIINGELKFNAGLSQISFGEYNTQKTLKIVSKSNPPGKGLIQGISISSTGELGIGTDNPEAILDARGKTKTQELQITNGSLEQNKT